MIDGVNLTPERIKKYENPEYKIPDRDLLSPIINKAIQRQNVDFFTDERSHNERNDI